MKVSEAKTKVCPFMSTAVFTPMGGADAFVNCICGDCMAWVYTKTIDKESEKLAHSYASVSHDAFDNRTYEEKLAYIKRTSTKIIELDESEKEGYCKRLGQ